MAGGELRFGTVATYMLTVFSIHQQIATTICANYMLTAKAAKHLKSFGAKDFS